jgi:hypothetical protein
MSTVNQKIELLMRKPFQPDGSRIDSSGEGNQNNV